VARAWIEDQWFNTDKVKTPGHGKGSRWKVYWWEDGTGQGRKRRSKRFARKPEAEQWAAKMSHDLRAGIYRPPEHAETRFADVANEWLHTRLDIKPATFRRYERELRAYVLPQWGGRRIGTITKPEVATWIAALSNGSAPSQYKVRGAEPPEYTRGPMNRPLSPASVDHVHTVLSAVLSWAVETDRISRNPAAGVRLPRVSAPEHVYLSHNQVHELATAASELSGDLTDKALIHFLAYTGLRINEALALRVSDVDFIRRRARVATTWTVDKEGRRILGSPKTHEVRSVALAPFLLDELVRLTTGYPRDAHVFRAARGGPINDHNWRTRVFNLAARDAGLGAIGLTPHKLRHTAASAAIAAGADVKVVQQMLGHKDATETLNTYGHLWPDRLDEVSNALERARSEALRAESPLTNVPKMSLQSA
jgi:integrase